MAIPDKIGLWVRTLGLAFIALGGIIILWSALFPRVFARTQGRLVAMADANVRNRVEPVVEFEVDGRKFRGRCQNVHVDSFDKRIGDEVDIIYSLRNTLNIETVKVYLDDGRNRARQDRATVMTAGSVFFVAGVALFVFSRKVLSQG